MSEDDPPVATVEFDQFTAGLTFDALERSMVKAAQEDEMGVAASYLDTLFFIQTQAPGLTETYHDQTEEMVEEDEAIREEASVLAEVMTEVKDWAHEHDHDVSQWFEPEQEVDDDA